MKQLFLPFVFLFFLGQDLQAQSLSNQELKELQNKMGQKKELKLDFLQTRVSALRPKKPVKSNGFAVFQKPNKFHWETTTPHKEVMIFDGTSLYNYKPGDQTATRYKTDGEQSQEIREVIDFVLDFDSLLKRYQLQTSLKKGNDITLTLTPKQKEGNGNIRELNIFVTGINPSVKSVKLTFQNNNTSEFQFFNPSFDRVDGALFKVPAGLKVVDGL